MKKRVIIGLNSAWNLYNFRSGLIRALVASGHEVIAVAPFDSYSAKLAELGCEYIPLPMDVKGKNPVNDLLLIFRLVKIFKDKRPDVFLGYTIKPNIYGSIAARFSNVKVINNIAGLGVAFQSKTLLTILVEKLYRISLSWSSKVFFQNQNDLQLFVSSDLVRKEVADRLPGSGVDLVKFTETPLQSFDGDRPFRFLLISRMLWSKGVGEFVEAARLVKKHNPKVEFCLVGFLEVKNPEAIARSTMDEWVAEGVVNYLGSTDNVISELIKADCVVLPSYYPEGVPRSLLEAAAIGRPIITTDTVGCREVVEDRLNGFLCLPRDAEDLAEKFTRFLSLNSDQLAQMGKHSRKLVETKFDENIVIKKYLEALDQLHH